MVYKSEEGFVLIGVIVLMVALMLGLGLHFRVTDFNLSTSMSEVASATGFNAAEAGVNVRSERIRNTLLRGSVLQGSPSTDECASSLGTGDFNCSSHLLGTFNVNTWVETSGTPTRVRIPAGEPYENLSAEEYSYVVSSRSTGKNDKVAAILDAEIKVRLVPLYQFSAFFDKDLEIHPGENMTFDGPVYSSGDLYLTTRKNLSLLSQVTSGGSLFIGQKSMPDCFVEPGVVQVNDPTSLRELPACTSRRMELNPSLFSSWNGRIVSNAEPITIPPPENFSVDSSGPFWSKADIRIVLNLNVAPARIEVQYPDETVSSTATAVLSSSYQNSFGSNPSSCVEDTGGSTSTRECRYFRSSLSTCVAPSTPASQRAGSSSIPADTLPVALLQSDSSPSYLPGASIVGYSNTFFDRRETPFESYTDPSKRVQLLELDMRGILDCIHRSSSSSTPLLSSGAGVDEGTDGGLVVFATVKGPRSLHAQSLYGIRLRNAQELQSSLPGAPRVKGFTLVSDQPVYVMGDYNAPTNRDERIPAAIIGDSITMLSSNWNTATLLNNLNADLKANDLFFRNMTNEGDADVKLESTIKLADGTTNARISRRGRATELNAAVIAGTDITGDIEGRGGQDRGLPSGGAHNFFRLHESFYDEFGKTATFSFSGSLVSLQKPNRAVGRMANVGTYLYYPPKRDWHLDTRFMDISKLPPLTPRFTYIRQTVMKRDYER
jgi:Tfp pilus assembly protein PilX